MLSLRFLLKHETGLGFGLWLETWWLIGGLGLPAWLIGGHPAGHAAKHESTIAVVKPVAKPCRADPNGLEVVEPCRLVVEKLILVAEKLI